MKVYLKTENYKNILLCDYWTLTKNYSVHSMNNKSSFLSFKKDKLFYKKFYNNGKLHNIHGPAINYTDGEKSFWIEDKKYSKDEWFAIIQNKIKLASL